MPLREDIGCYAGIEQRQVLSQLATNPDISTHFFLTRGTALSVFFLHHRTAEDLDLFTLDQVNFVDITFWIRSEWPHNHSIIRSNPHVLSLLVKDVKVDFVYDPLSISSTREIFNWENGGSLKIDTIMNIASNKLCALVSRSEPKDLVDLYFLFAQISTLEFKDVLLHAKRKEALFDDPPTAAYQIEEGIRFVKEHEEIIPPLKKDLKMDSFYKFYDDFVMYFYNMIKSQRPLA